MESDVWDRVLQKTLQKTLQTPAHTRRMRFLAIAASVLDSKGFPDKMHLRQMGCVLDFDEMIIMQFQWYYLNLWTSIQMGRRRSIKSLPISHPLSLGLALILSDLHHEACRTPTTLARRTPPRSTLHLCPANVAEDSCTVSPRCLNCRLLRPHPDHIENCDSLHGFQLRLSIHKAGMTLIAYRLHAD